MAKRKNSKKIAIWTVVGAIAVAAGVVLLVRFEHWRPKTLSIQGAVIRHDADTRKELPIAGAVVTASDSVVRATTLTDATGYFRIKFRERVWPEDVVTLDFRHPDYKPLAMNLPVTLHTKLNKLFVAKMNPVSAPAPVVPTHAHTIDVSDVRVRYTVINQTETNVGSAVRVLQVVNQGNVPCQPKDTCSPDGRWKAAKGSVKLDAGPGNVFDNVRASCIAGPCPFTRIDVSGSDHPSETIEASALDWSDTATFLVEAEVFREDLESKVRESYPVKYGRDLHFTAPPTAEGVSIEAEVAGTEMVFPLGPDLYMSWAACASRKGPNNDTIYQCELKPGYNLASK